jgi:uncharacterized protein YndB with AHSA1/START domain
MTTTSEVVHTVTVPLSPERAFELFVHEHASWWPRDSHHLADGQATAHLEPHEGGRWYERAEDGTECEWGRLLVYEPPARIVLAWQLDPDFVFNPDPAKQTEVEVRFEPEGAGTRVTLEHRGFEVHAERGAGMRDSVNREGGWPELLGIYAGAASP